MPPPPHSAHRPHRGNLAYPESPLESARKCLFWGWWLVGGGCVLALIPFLGILVWFIAPPLVITGFVLAIVAIAKGRTAGGLCLLLFSMFVAPFTLILGPILAALLGVAATADDSTQPKLPAFMNTGAPSSAPTTEAEMAKEREEIERQLNSRSRK